jgi:predicted O-methyltransferase YrrM
LKYDHGHAFLKIVSEKKPKHFLEIGVFTGVTARNICELLNDIHGKDFQYTGLDLFEDYVPEHDHEIAPNMIRGNQQKFSNPLKHIVYNLILREQLNSLNSVTKFLKKFKNQVELVKGDSKKTLPEIEIEKYDMIFVDGGHSFETVNFELQLIMSKCKKDCLVLVDDYDLQVASGVKKAVDQIVSEKKLKLNIFSGRFAQISF